jgi:hypothetical protein
MEFLGEWIIRDSHLVNEYRSEIGITWIELFPYAFCESSQLSLDAADAVIQVIDPHKERLVLVATGVASEYRASVPLFKRAVERVIEFLPNNDLSSYTNDFGQLDVAKVLANLSLGGSHDVVGSRWIDRFDWTDQIAPQIISENRNSVVHHDANRNLGAIRELNWMVAVLTSDNLYRSLTDDDFENWDIWSGSVRAARAFGLGEPERIDEFYRVDCDNTFVRDIAMAHLTFEQGVDPNPMHNANPGLDATGANRAEARGQLIDSLLRDGFPDSWTLNPIVPLDDYKERIDWLSDYAKYDFPEIAEGRQDITFVSESINRSTSEIGDKFSKRQWDYANLILAFRNFFPYLFSGHKIDPSWSQLAIHENDYAGWARWVHDEIAYTGYSPDLYITGTQHSDAFEPFDWILKNRNAAAAARVLPILGYLHLSEIREHRGSEPTAFPRNGFSQFWAFFKGFYGVYHDRFPNDWN